MTKVVKFWKKFSFWTKLKGTLGLFGVGGEITMIMTHQPTFWHVVTIIATVGSILITNFIQDENKDGIVD